MFTKDSTASDKIALEWVMSQAVTFTPVSTKLNHKEYFIHLMGKV
jgi:hypothetical protein